MTLLEYSSLKAQIIVLFNKVNNSERLNILNSLKETFRTDINSVRRYEQINQMSQLLQVLELRDVLSESNLEPLKQVIKKLPNSSDLLEKTTEFEKSRLGPREYTNYYDSENTFNRDPPIESLIYSNPVSGMMSKRKKQRVFKTISDQIGIFWRDLGRNLNIRECVIDEINDSQCSLPAKATKIMNEYEEIADPQRWFLVLCTALEKSRRKDLERDLQEIMAMNI